MAGAVRAKIAAVVYLGRFWQLVASLKSFWPQEQVPRGKKRAVQNPAETSPPTVSGNARFGSLADIREHYGDVGFTPGSSHAVSDNDSFAGVCFPRAWDQ